MKKYTERSMYQNKDRPKQRGEYAASRAKYIEHKREETERRRHINPRLLVLNVDFFDLLMEQEEQR